MNTKNTKNFDSLLNRYINADSLSVMKKMKLDSIDCVILDPPYFKIVSEHWDNNFKQFDDYIKWITEYIETIDKIAKKNTVVWLFGFNYQLGKILPIFEKNNFKYKQTIVINKGLKSVAGRSSTKLRMFPTATEYIYFFYRDSTKTIRDFLRNKKSETDLTSSDINKYLGKAINGGGTWSSIAGKNQKGLQYPTIKDWKKLQILLNFNEKYEDFVYTFVLPKGITDVWSDINFYIKRRIHATQKPDELIKRIILSSTSENQIILDPFSGSGVVGKLCCNLKRNFICIEKDIDIYNKCMMSVEEKYGK